MKNLFKLVPDMFALLCAWSHIARQVIIYLLSKFEEKKCNFNKKYVIFGKNINFTKHIEIVNNFSPYSTQNNEYVRAIS